MALVIILGIAIALFVLAFVTKRRFGLLGLGLTGGVVLAQLWGVTIAALLQAQGANVGPLSYATVGQVAVTLLPALILLIAGPKYHSKKGALLGAVLFSVFGTLLVFSPISRDFAVAGDSNQFIDGILAWRNVLIAFAVLLSIGDIIVGHHAKAPHHGKDKH